MDKPVKRIDHIMWDMDTPTSLVTIVGMMTIKGKLRKKELEEVVENRLLQYPRFRQRIVMKGKKPMWHDDENFNIHAHIHHIALPNPGGYKELQEVIGDLMTMSLDYTKPLWQVHMIDNYEGNTALIWRIHHAIADGIALIKVVFSLTADSAEDSLKKIRARKDPSEEADLPLSKSIRQRIDNVIHLGEDLYGEAADLLKEPGKLKDTLADSWATTKELAGILLERSGRHSFYKGDLSVVKNAAWSGPIGLECVKRIGKKNTATINDVLLTILSGTVRRHLLMHEQEIDGHFRVICPVNMHKDGAVHIENKLGMISIDLPVHVADFKERIQIIREKTAALKRSMEPLAVFSILNLAGDLIPAGLERKAANYFGSKVMGVLSNVPGPRHPIYFSGIEVDEIMFWIPQTNALGMGISMISYNGRVFMGISTDDQVIKEPDLMVKCFMDEFTDICEQMQEDPKARS